MAERRMFAKSITDSDTFLNMTPKAQMLYFHLAMHADDDGFVGNPKRVQKMIGASEKDMTALLDLQFVIPFESGVCVIKHWRIHNYIRGDRYTETVYKSEKQTLFTDENKAYSILDTTGIPSDNQPGDKRSTQDRLGKDRLGKERTGGTGGQPAAATRPRKKFIPPTVEQVAAYCREKGYHLDPELFVAHYEANGWKQGRGKPIVSWKAAVLTWDRRDKADGKKQEENDYGEFI